MSRAGEAGLPYWSASKSAAVTAAVVIMQVLSTFMIWTVWGAWVDVSACMLTVWQRGQHLWKHSSGVDLPHLLPPHLISLVQRFKIASAE